jgi:hypothetical protein
VVVFTGVVAAGFTAGFRVLGFVVGFVSAAWRFRSRARRFASVAAALQRSQRHPR